MVILQDNPSVLLYRDFPSINPVWVHTIILFLPALALVTNIFSSNHFPTLNFSPVSAIF